MKISSVNYFNSGLFNARNVAFSGKHKDCFGETYIDDNYTSEFKRHNGEIVGYNDKRLRSDLAGLTRPTIGSPVEDENLQNMHINSLRDIGNNCLKGGLAGASDYVQELKDYGVKEFIMLCEPNECNIIEECKKHDMPINRIFMPSTNVINPQQIREFRNRLMTRDYVDAIKSLREGNCFVGCESGNIRTKHFLATVKLLDPKCKLDLGSMHIYPGDYECAQVIYSRLSEEDKKALGYTEEFEKELSDRLKSGTTKY